MTLDLTALGASSKTNGQPCINYATWWTLFYPQHDNCYGAHDLTAIPINQLKVFRFHSSLSNEIFLAFREKLIEQCDALNYLLSKQGKSIIFSHFRKSLNSAIDFDSLTRRVSLAVERLAGASCWGICDAVIPLNPIVLLLIACCWLSCLIPVTTGALTLNLLLIFQFLFFKQICIKTFFSVVTKFFAFFTVFIFANFQFWQSYQGTDFIFCTKNIFSSTWNNYSCWFSSVI